MINGWVTLGGFVFVAANVVVLAAVRAAGLADQRIVRMFPAPLSHVRACPRPFDWQHDVPELAVPPE